MAERESGPSVERPLAITWGGTNIDSGKLSENIMGAVGEWAINNPEAPQSALVKNFEVHHSLVEAFGSPALQLKSVINIDKNSKILTDHAFAAEYFADLLNVPVEQRSRAASRVPLKFETTSFLNVFIISEFGGGRKFALCLDSVKNTIEIANKTRLSSTNGREPFVLNMPKVDAISADDDLRVLEYITYITDEYIKAYELAHPQDSTAEVKVPEVDATPASTELVALGRAATRPPLDQAAINETLRLTKEQITKDDDKLVTIDDIGGYEHIKKIMRTIVASFGSPETMSKWGARRPQALLLYGPAGVGKTMFVQALANELGAELRTIEGKDIYNMYLSNSEKQLAAIFDRASKSTKPLVLFLDEFDTMMGRPDSDKVGGASGERGAVAGLFQKRMDQLREVAPNVFVAAATNYKDRIAPSLIRSGRFDYIIPVTLPDEAARKEIVFNIIMKATKFDKDDFRVYGSININAIAVKTDGLSGSDITEIFRRLPLKKAIQEVETGVQPPPIAQAEVEAEIAKFLRGE